MNGYTLEETISLYLEDALNRFLKDLTDEIGYHFIHKLPIGMKSGLGRKLLVYDESGTAYNVDSIIADKWVRPMILIESEGVLYEQDSQNRSDWLCKAHPAIRRRYSNIKSSIMVLAGTWSSTSIASLRSCGINVVLIPFQLVCDLFSVYGITLDWGEKERGEAANSWARYSALTTEQRLQIGDRMINFIKPDLGKLILSLLRKRQKVKSEGR
jgi:hypothetical protein